MVGAAADCSVMHQLVKIKHTGFAGCREGWDAEAGTPKAAAAVTFQHNTGSGLLNTDYGGKLVPEAGDAKLHLQLSGKLPFGSLAGWMPS